MPFEARCRRVVGEWAFQPVGVGCLVLGLSSLDMEEMGFSILS
jgi:hypothetical protein